MSLREENKAFKRLMGTVGKKVKVYLNDGGFQVGVLNSFQMNVGYAFIIIADEGDKLTFINFSHIVMMKEL